MSAFEGQNGSYKEINLLIFNIIVCILNLSQLSLFLIILAHYLTINIIFNFKFSFCLFIFITSV